MASVTPRVTSRGTVWQVRYREGARHRARSFTREDAARRWAGLVDSLGVAAAEAALTVPKAATAPTVREWMTQHIDDLTGITEGTRSDYRSYVRNEIGPALGAYPLPLLDRSAVAAWINDMARRGLSGKTIRNRHSLLSAALSEAVTRRIISEHPCKGMKMPRTEHRKQEMVFLSNAEAADVISRLPEHWRPLTTFLVGTGARFGEATALLVGDITQTGGRWSARITKAWKHTDGHGFEIGPPKSEKGTRTVRLPPEVVAQLDLHRPPDALLFTSPNGVPVRLQRFHDVWRPATEHLARRPRVHDLRHTFVAWALSSGIPLAVLQRQLGHESITTTVDTYGHLAPADFDALADATSAALRAPVRQIEG